MIGLKSARLDNLTDAFALPGGDLPHGAPAGRQGASSSIPGRWLVGVGAISDNSANTWRAGVLNISFYMRVFLLGGVSARNVTVAAQYVGCGGVTETPLVRP